MNIFRSFSTFLRVSWTSTATARLRASTFLRLAVRQWLPSGLKPKRIAVLIDGDNAAPSSVGSLLSSCAKTDSLVVKRVYGDFSLVGLKCWQQVILAHAIVPVHWHRNTPGKNATDMRMTIDAMDLLYSGGFNEFWIISSDSDFAALAWRIRRQGLTVRGFGANRTPKAFLRACDMFGFTGGIRNETEHIQTKDIELLAEFVKNAVLEAANEAGWAPLSLIGDFLHSALPGFQPNQYGFSKMSALVGSMKFLEVAWHGPHYLVRLKPDET